MRRALSVLAVAVALASCGDGPTAATPDSPPVPTTSSVVTSPPGPSTTAATSTTSASSTRPSSTTTIATTASSTTIPTSTPYVIPVADAAGASWADTHSTYPATDIFNGGCGGAIVSPVNGVLLEVRRVNAYDPVIDNPATRGGRSVSILGDDGVRYYLAHFDLVDESLQPGAGVGAGDHLGTIGTTGRSSACHVHFGMSPPCPEREWSVRRGVVWPYRYLDDWRSGGQASPADEVAAFVAEQPGACASAADDPVAADA